MLGDILAKLVDEAPVRHGGSVVGRLLVVVIRGGFREGEKDMEAQIYLDDR